MDYKNLQIKLLAQTINTVAIVISNEDHRIISYYGGDSQVAEKIYSHVFEKIYNNTVIRDLDDMPHIYEDENIFFWGFKDRNDCTIIFGPIGSERLGHEQIKKYHFEYKIYVEEDGIPKYNIKKMVDFIRLIALLILEKEFTAEQICGFNKINMISNDKDIVRYQIYRHEESKKRASYEEEQNCIVGQLSRQFSFKNIMSRYRLTVTVCG